MSFPPQSQGGGYGPPPPPTGGDSYGYQHQAPHQPPQSLWTPPPSEGKRPRGPKTVAITVGAVVLVAAAVGGLALGLGGGDGEGDQAAANDKTTPSGNVATGAEAGAGTQGTPSPSAGGQAGADLVRYVVLRRGQCFDHPGLSSGVTQVTTRSCDMPHDGEVIANEQLTGSFTTSAELRGKVLKLCEADAKKRMESIPADGKTYYYYAIYPSLNTYTAQKKDTISCALTLSNKQGGKKLAKPLP